MLFPLYLLNYIRFLLKTHQAFRRNHKQQKVQVNGISLIGFEHYNLYLHDKILRIFMKKYKRVRGI